LKRAALAADTVAATARFRGSGVPLGAPDLSVEQHHRDEYREQDARRHDQGLRYSIEAVQAVESCLLSRNRYWMICFHYSGCTHYRSIYLSRPSVTKR
jgi:hypothetical protein